MPQRIAVVMGNLGGPDSLKAVRPFLVHLFNDPAIINLPQPFRTLLAYYIAIKRGKLARKIYAAMGGKSPILENTEIQAIGLEGQLKKNYPQKEFKVFVAMRYWHPFVADVAYKVKLWQADQVLVLPLYPQFSTTTTWSLLSEWKKQAGKQGIAVPFSTVCCYPQEEHFILSHKTKIEAVVALAKKQKHFPLRLLFSAHGLPEKIVQKGDPYAWQIEQTVHKIIESMEGKIEWALCYQSRVGKLKWIGPSTEEEIKRAGRDRIPVALVPVSFVSEHAETLVEMDMEYKTLAGKVGVPAFYRVPALQDDAYFLKGLVNICGKMLVSETDKGYDAGRVCPKNFSACPLHQEHTNCIVPGT